MKRLQVVAEIFANALARKRADQALRESETRLTLAAESAGAGLWSLNLSSGEFWLTSKTRELFGFHPSERVTFERFLEVVHPEDQPQVREMVQEMVRSERQLLIEYRVIRPDGALRWMSARGRLQSSAAGGPRFLMGVTLDVTPRKQAEEALRGAQTTLNAIINSTADFIWSVDPVHFGLTTFNQGLSDYFLRARGIRLQLGMAPKELLPTEEQAEQWRQFYKRALREGPFVTEYVTHGQRHVLQLSFNLLRRDDNVFGVSVFGRDLTDQKKAEQEAHELRANLTHLTRVNTVAVFAGSLAHELTQPLASILNNAQAGQLLMASPVPDLREVNEILSDIVAAHRRAVDLIQGLRQLFRKQPPSFEQLPINQLIEEVLKLTRADLGRRGITLLCKLHPNLPLISGDRVQLQQVLLNLIVNATEAMEKNETGTRQVHIETTCREGWVRASVRDLGDGVSSNRERLFQPFFTTKPGGLGLGLAICRSIMDVHRGRIWAEPHPEAGAIFSFELPVGPGAGTARPRNFLPTSERGDEPSRS